MANLCWDKQKYHRDLLTLVRTKSRGLQTESTQLLYSLKRRVTRCVHPGRSSQFQTGKHRREVCWEHQLSWGRRTPFQRTLILATVEAWKKLNYSSWKCNVQLPVCPARPLHLWRSQERRKRGCRKKPWPWPEGSWCSTGVLGMFQWNPPFLSPFFIVTLIC